MKELNLEGYIGKGKVRSRPRRNSMCKYRDYRV